jgi:long-chain acyl-CoA synthetase
MARMVQVKIREAGFLNRFLYRYCLKIGYLRGALAEKGLKGNWLLQALILMADVLIFYPLRENLGLRKCSIATTGSAAMSVDTFRFWSAIGVRLKQVYGSTEAGFVAGHRSDKIYFETLGNISTCAEVRISENQEILVKGPQVFSGYYQALEKTDGAFEKGWLRTGDAGFIDPKGHLVFLDRLKDLQLLSNGTRYAPQYIEGRLRFSPYIKDAMALGGEARNFIAVIIIIDFENVGKWAEENHLTYTTFADLSQKDEVAGLISKDIHRVNQGFRDEIKVKKFVVLHKEFDPDEDELTRTRKIRRSYMEERYGDLVDAIYARKSEVKVETQVRYRDGRQASMNTHIKIWTPLTENP